MAEDPKANTVGRKCEKSCTTWETKIKKWWKNLPQNPFRKQNGPAPKNQRHHKICATIVKPWWNLPETLVEPWRNLGGTLVEPSKQPFLFQKTRNTTNTVQILVEPWRNSGGTFRGTSVEPQWNLGSPRWTCPREPEKPQNLKNFVDLGETWRNLGGTFRGTFGSPRRTWWKPWWSPRRICPREPKTPPNLENFGGTLLEPSAETCGNPRRVCPGQPETPRDFENFGGTLVKLGVTLVEPSAELFGSPRRICPREPKTPWNFENVGASARLVKAWWNLGPIGGTFSGTFWQPKTGLPQNQVENTFAPKPLNMAEDPKSYRRRGKISLQHRSHYAQMRQKTRRWIPGKPKAMVFWCVYTAILHTKHALHQTTFTTNNFCIRHPLHQKPFTPDILQQTTFTPGTLYNVYTRHSLHQTPFTTFPTTTFTPATLYTRHPLHQEPFAPNNFYTKHSLHQTSFTQNFFYTRQLLHPTTFTTNNFAEALKCSHPQQPSWAATLSSHPALVRVGGQLWVRY